MMKTKRLVWNQVDKSKIRLDRLAEEYLLVYRTEGKSPKTLRGYQEKLGRFYCWLETQEKAEDERNVRACRLIIWQSILTWSLNSISSSR